MSQSLLPIHTIAGKLNLPEEYFEPIGRHGAKLKLDILSDPAFPRRGKLILVTATTYVLINLVVDVLYVFIDPRIRYG